LFGKTTLTGHDIRFTILGFTPHQTPM